jgi:hypothetical protein
MISRRNFVTTTAGAIAAASVGLWTPRRASASPSTTRPIADFLDAQGSTSDFLPPIPDYVGWTASADLRAASVDYAGLSAGWLLEESGGAIDLGTTASGTVLERPLKDGRAQISVDLYTTDALSWAMPFDPTSFTNQFLENPLLFGARGFDVLDGANPALGDSHFQLVYINTAPGDPLQDVVVAFIGGLGPPGVELISVSFYATASGELRALAGLGPDGTPGKCIVTQTGTLFRSHNFGGATGDGFPAEQVELRRVRR